MEARFVVLLLSASSITATPNLQSLQFLELGAKGSVGKWLEGRVERVEGWVKGYVEQWIKGRIEGWMNGHAEG